MSERRLLTDKEKMEDSRFPSVAKVFPEFDCYSDGTYEYNKDKTPPGFSYIMDVAKGKIKKPMPENDLVIHIEFPKDDML